MKFILRRIAHSLLMLGFLLHAAVSLATTFTFSTPTSTSYQTATGTQASVLYVVTNSSGTTLNNISFIPPTGMSAFIQSYSNCLSPAGLNSLKAANGTCTLIITFTAPGPSAATTSLGALTVCAQNGTLCNSTTSSQNVTVTPLANSYAYVANNTSNTVTAINTLTYATNTTAAIAGAGLTQVAVSPDGFSLYATGNTTGKVYRFSLTNPASPSLSVTSTVTMTGGNGVGVTLDGAAVIATGFSGTTMYCMKGLTLTACSGTNNTATTQNNPIGMGISPDGTLAVVGNGGSGSVSVVGITYNSTGAVGFTSASATNTAFAGSTAGFLSITPDGQTIWMPSGSATGGLYGMSLTNPSININNAAVCGTPDGVAIPPFGYNGVNRYVVIGCSGAGNTVIQKFNPDTLKLIGQTSIGTTSYELAYTPDGSKIYISNNGGSTVSIVDSYSFLQDSVQPTVTVGSAPQGIAFLP